MVGPSVKRSHAAMMISKKSLFSWVLERYRGLQLILFALILSTIILRVFPLEMQKRIVNEAIALRKLDALLIYCTLYLAAVVVAGLFKYFINVLQGYIGQRILLDMRSQLYRHILTLPLPFFSHTPPGMVIASLTSELSTVGEFLGGAIAIPTINVLTLLAFAGYMAYLNPLLAILSFSVYPLEILIVPILQKRFNRLNRERIEVTRSMSNVIGEAISGMHEIQGNGSYELENAKLMKLAKALFFVRHRMNLFKFLTKFSNNFFQSLGPFILFIVGGYLTVQGRFDLGALVAFLSAYEKLYDPWKELMDYYQDFQDSKVRYRQIMEAFDLKPEFQLLPEQPRSPVILSGEITVQELSFVIDGQLRLLDQISFHLKPGEHLALVGLSGSGKSTLAMVVAQLYSYNSGRVLLDEKELRNLTRFDISHNVGFIAQYPFIFDGTIQENLLYGCRSLSPSTGCGEGACPPCDEVLRLLDKIGFGEDILSIGLSKMLSRETDQELATRFLVARHAFLNQWRNEFTDMVDFFESDRFQYHSTIAENIVFGQPARKDFTCEKLATDPLFRRFLDDLDLTGPLIRLGQEIATRTVSLLKGLEEDAFFFQMSPIAPEDFPFFSEIVEKSPRDVRHVGVGSEIVEALIGLALRFIPALHKMASLYPSLERQILEARRTFKIRVQKEAPGAFMFYDLGEYLFAHTVLENIVFGHLKAENPQGNEKIRSKALEILRDASLLDELMKVGLQFQVGSKGDRLSGGQKQKIGIARALLKTPQILIMDEATANLDNASQNRIYYFLETELKGKTTLIAVIHRLELVQQFDKIAVMKGGRIVEMGSFQELLTKKGLFYELFTGKSSSLQS